MPRIISSSILFRHRQEATRGSCLSATRPHLTIGSSMSLGTGAIAAAATPPVLGLAPTHLVKYQQRTTANFSRQEAAWGPQTSTGPIASRRTHVSTSTYNQSIPVFYRKPATKTPRTALTLSTPLSGGIFESSPHDRLANISGADLWNKQDPTIAGFTAFR